MRQRVDGLTRVVTRPDAEIAVCVGALERELAAVLSSEREVGGALPARKPWSAR
ncbi:MAG TPA: hypothetical protein VFA81_10050 [Burkholderiales bacterium]|nr:hypothetical protein [Burkholderiales bacterium]